MGILTGILTVLLILVCVALIGLILIQRGKGGGLAGVFGGGGVEQAFGTHAATMAQKATAALAVLFLVITIVLGIRLGRGSSAIESSDTTPMAPAPAQSPAAPDQMPLGPAPSLPGAPAETGN